eukprot:GSChrysophyteH1.ASY1.ANO1.2899.1 assembled CDS
MTGGDDRKRARINVSFPRRMIYSALHDNSDPINDDMDSYGVEMNEISHGSHGDSSWKDEIAATTDIVLSSSPEADLLNRSSWLSCYINLTSTILGAGMLGLPYAYANMGWLLGTTLIIVCGVTATMALFFLAKCAKKTSAPSSFYKVAMLATPKYAFSIDLIIAIKCFGVATSYLVVVGDLMPLAMAHMYPNSLKLLDRNLWVGVGFLVVAPLSCLRSLDALRWTSGLSGVFLAFLISLVVGYAMPNITGLDPSSDCHGDRAFLLISAAAMHVMPIFIFGYACQQNSFGIVNELVNPTIQRINSVFVASIGTAIVVYIVMASAGYLAFGDTVKSNILVSYPNNNITSTARIFVSIVVAFHYPLQAHPARRSMLSLITHLAGEQAEPTEYSVYWRRYSGCMVLFLGLSVAIALSVADLGLMLSLVGATGSTAISFILPGIFYYKMFEGEGPQWLRKVSWYQFIAGLLLVPFSLVAIFVVKAGKNGGSIG